MIYKDFQNLKLSALGLGCMRLPKTDNDDKNIDMQATTQMVDYAIKNGVNYFDTAWGYHGGQSEIVIGKVLKNYPRESFYLASKFPGYDISLMPRVEKIFEKQLEKCGVDYFDFYLFHNVCELNIDMYLDRKYGIYDYLLKQKEKGRIKHLGFSVHGDINTTRRFLEAYGEGMEFCQIQLNYVDWTFQDAKAKIELLDSYGIPVWVMEPVRGGKLATLDKKHTDILKKLRPDESVTDWAFRFVQSVPQVVVTLSGMSNLEQLKQNIAVFSEEKPLNECEKAALQSIVGDMLDGKTVMCTGCNYCVSHCPQSLNIPELMSLYNEHSFSNGGFIAPMRISSLPEDKRPSACIGCRSCESVCPQGIKISDILKQFTEKLK